ncbi:MAG: RnfH family protein [Burkholderiales bacterium]
MVPNEIAVEVVYALPHEQKSIRLTVASNATVQEALELSGLLANHPEIDLENVGIFGKRVQQNTVLQDRDRIEIYRPLAVDPKEARRARLSRG